MIGYDPTQDTGTDDTNDTEGDGDNDGPDFKPPASLDLSGRKPGDEFEVVTKVRLDDDGDLCIVAVNGIPLDGASKSKSKTSKSADDSEGSDDSSTASTPADQDNGFLASMQRRGSALPS